MPRRSAWDVYVPSDEVFAAFERLYREVEDVRSILLDTDRTSARLVVNPARVVIDETRRSFAYLSLYGGGDGRGVGEPGAAARSRDGLFCALGAARTLRTRRNRAVVSRTTVSRSAVSHRAHWGWRALSELAAEIYGDKDPAALFTRARPIRLAKRNEVTVMEIDLVHASPDELDVAIHGDQLLVRVRDARRRIALPDSVAGRSIVSAKLNDGVLEVAFEA